MRWIVYAVVGAATIALGVVLRLRSDMTSDATAEGLLFVLAGLAAWARWPSSRTGPYLLAYTPLVWSIQLQHTRTPLLWTAGAVLFAWFFVPLTLALVTFPTGRTSSVWQRLTVAAVVFSSLWQTMLITFYDPGQLGCGMFGGADCDSGLNLILVKSSPRLLSDLAQADPYLVSLFLLPAAAYLVVQWSRATGVARWTLTPMTVAGLLWIVSNRVSGFADAIYYYQGRVQLIGAHPFTLRVFDRIEEAAIIALPVTFLVGLAGSRLRHLRLSRLVVELGELPSADALEHALQRALGDPLLRVGVWHGTSYVGTDGAELVPPADDGVTVATLLERDGQPLAVMVHDRALLDEPGLVEATAAATRLAVENERLQAEIRVQLDEVHASRQRIVAAADAERQRIERNLHDGAQQRLLRLSMALQVAKSRLADEPDPALRTSLEVAAEELQLALTELRELAQGIHPGVLTQRGLGAALLTLAETSAIPAIVEDVPGGRLPELVEIAGYYVVSEALANVAKHAAATRAVVRAVVHDDALTVTVTDDGVGGAALTEGSGLRGLSDRVQALDGELLVASRVDEGTTVTAYIPFGSAD